MTNDCFEPEELIARIGAEFFNVVPSNYKTYCSLTARISQFALQCFGVSSELKSCQLWHLGSRSNFVIGFVGHQKLEGKWGGHVVCVSGEYIVDATVSHLARDFGVSVPDVIVGKCFDVPSRILCRVRLSDNESLMWIEPPRKFNPVAPVQPEAIIEQYGKLLADRIRCGYPLHEVLDRRIS